MTTSMSDIECYFFRIYHDERRGNTVTCLTHWVGFADKEFRVEMRAASKTPLDMLRRHNSNNGDGDLQFISQADELYRFWVRGGVAAIEAKLAEELIQDHLIARPMTNTGFGAFTVTGEPLAQATRRAPNPKLRMRVFQRDNFRCRVCGQSPEMDTNVVLHVHHIRPWANYGATVMSNLVTLCHTCHEGLHPHWNLKLAMLIEDTKNLPRRWRSPPRPEE